MPDNADDGHPRICRLWAAKLDSLADRIGCRPIRLRHGLVDDRHRPAGSGVVILEVASRNELRSDSFKIPRSDESLIRFRILAGPNQRTVRSNGSRPAVAAQWQTAHGASELNAGNLAHPVEKILEKRIDFGGLGISRGRKRHPDRQNALSLETGIDGLESHKALNQ